MAFSATSNARVRRRTSAAASTSPVFPGDAARSGRAGGRRRAATAPSAQPGTIGRPVSVTLRVPPPALRIGRLLALGVDELGRANRRRR